MALNVNNALTLQFGQSLGVEHKVFNCLVNALVGGLNIDDGAQFVFVKDGVVFGFSPTNAHNDKMIDYKSFKETFGKDYALVLKFHPFTLGKENLSEEEKELYGDFVYLCPPEIGIDTAMCAADILISDYSSLIFEYSLLSRPMIFFAYDLDEYEHSRDYYYNYIDFVPGPIVKTSDELLQAVADAAQNGANHKIIDDFRDKFMSACDGGSAQRIADFVEKNN